MQDKKVNIQTFGCQMNEYDSEKMLRVLNEENYTYVDSPDYADLIILNTCSVREKAEQKVYSQLGRFRPLKVKNPDLLIGVGGCVAQQEGQAILRRDPNVNFVFGTDNLFDLPDMLQQAKQGRRVVQTQRVAYRQKVRNYIPDFAFNLPESRIKSYISITKGCNNFCTFCIVPTTRGLEVSREPENIIEEATKLADKGVKEICLLGQNVNSYRTKGVNFVELLRQLDQIEGIQRIRFTSPHPKDFHAELADALRDFPSVCEHMHLPLQAGSDRILKRMKRRYTLEQFLEKVDLLRSKIPHAGLSTDLIVGFPGETDEDFEQTLYAIQKIRFNQIYAFKYSIRPGTPAEKYDGQLEDSVKVERLRTLLEVQEQIVEEIQQELQGKEQEVLVEGSHPKDVRSRSGKSRENLSVVIQNSQAKLGDLVRVKITGTKKYSLEAQEMPRPLATF